MLVALAFCASLAALAQDASPKKPISSDALSPEQVAIYRTVLARYSKNFPGLINLANTTGPFEDSSMEEAASCMKGIQAKGAGESATLHHVTSSVVAGLSFELVDPELQAEKVKENDPQHLVRQGGATEDQIGKAVEEAFRTGLFTLSEVAFDAAHDHAVVSYSFWCGRLCGHGEVLKLKKNGIKWSITKSCVSWVS